MNKSHVHLLVSPKILEAIASFTEKGDRNIYINSLIKKDLKKRGLL